MPAKKSKTDSKKGTKVQSSAKKAKKPLRPAVTKAAEVKKEEPTVKKKAVAPRKKAPVAAKGKLVASVQKVSAITEQSFERPSVLAVTSEPAKQEPAKVEEKDIQPKESVAVIQAIKAPPPPQAVKPKKKITITPQTTVKDLSQHTGLGVAEIIKKLMSLGVWATINQKIDPEVASLIINEQGFEAEVASGFIEDELMKAARATKVDERELVARAPIVTIMGHVDHGKTTLLDAIRQTNVAEKEAGGITQHIGAYKVKVPKGEVVFLDTPGHEAFTAMRSRGAKATDVVVLVVAADDGVMPQTLEAIDHAKAGGVPIVVAINKIDKPESNINKIKQELSGHGLAPEEWGGKTVMVEVSAKRRINLDKLLEIILLEAELLELKANPKRRALGVVLEARKDPKKGNLVTVLIADGTLKVGDVFVAGLTWGKVRAMSDEHGKRLIEAKPSTPVLMLGFQDLPQAGDNFIAVEAERQAKELSQRRRAEFEAIHGKTASKHLTLEDLHKKIESGEVKELRVILRTDAQGSLEAIVGELSKLHHEEVVIKILHSGLGDVTLGDVLLAAASDAVILGFHVGVDPKGQEEAKKENVETSIYSVIYELISDIKAALEGLLTPIITENKVALLDVRQVFRVSGVGNIAGCFVSQGKLSKENLVRVSRGGQKVFEGKIASLKRFKDDVSEMGQGFECGVAISGFGDLRKGDQIEGFIQVKELRKLASRV